MEGLLQEVPDGGHGLGTNGEAAVDGTGGDLCSDVLNCFEARAAEAVRRGCSCSCGDASCERGSAADVSGFTVIYLETIVKLYGIIDRKLG